MDNSRLHRIAQRQCGLVTTAQARTCGFSYRQIRHRVRTGQWQAITSRVVALPGFVWSAAARDRAAQLAVPGSIVAGPSAARVWGMPVPDGPPCLAVAPNRHPSFRGARFLRVDLAPGDLARGPGSMAVTARERTVFDCLYLLPPPAAESLLDRALQQRWITIDELADRIRNHVGRRGVRRLLQLLRRAAAGTRSEAERLMVRLLVRARIEGWVANHPIRDSRGLIGIGDVVFAGPRVVIELDGWAYHSDPEPFQRDRERQNRLVAAGWTVLRFTWRDLTEHPDRVIRTVRSILARNGWITGAGGLRVGGGTSLWGAEHANALPSHPAPSVIPRRERGRRARSRPVRVRRPGGRGHREAARREHDPLPGRPARPLARLGPPPVAGVGQGAARPDRAPHPTRWSRVRREPLRPALHRVHRPEQLVLPVLGLGRGPLPRLGRHRPVQPQARGAGAVDGAVGEVAARMDLLGRSGEARLAGVLATALRHRPRPDVMRLLAPSLGLPLARRVGDLVGLYPLLYRPFPDHDRLSGLLRLAASTDVGVLHAVAAAAVDAATGEAGAGHAAAGEAGAGDGAAREAGAGEAGAGDGAAREEGGRRQLEWSTLYAEDAGLLGEAPLRPLRMELRAAGGNDRSAPSRRPPP